MDKSSDRRLAEFTNTLDKFQKARANLLVMSIPGLGVSHLARRYHQAKNSGAVKYIFTDGDSLGEFNILDFGFDINPDALSQADNYFRKAGIDQKFVLLVTNPVVVGGDEFKKSYLSSHIYKTYWLVTLTREESADLALDFDKSLTPKELEKIWQLAGGIPQLVKYLAVNRIEVNKEVEEVVKNEVLEKIIHPIVKVTSRMNEADLVKMGIVKAGIYTSRILESAIRSKKASSEADIKVNFDLSFGEDGLLAESKLTETEKRILEYMLENKNQISKDQVADLKWGKGSYAAFSDQAIGKAMRRLGGKLERYKVVTVVGVGYILDKK